MNILLTGKPGVGKSTVIQKVIGKIGIEGVSGFWSLEIRVKGRRVGFSIQTTDGAVGTLAHVDNTEGPRVGNYVVSTKDIEEIAIPALRHARESSKIIIIDEIAAMELQSPLFAPEVRRCLDTGRVVGTLQMHSGTFQDEVREHPDTILLHITLENRNSIPAKVFSLL
ncbi:MAG: AAA family ATPase [Candidatus Thorarchaeota archaeon]|nr:AAA family ATPase [Candidatus Thorarchaeota archaeon]